MNHSLLALSHTQGIEQDVAAIVLNIDDTAPSNSVYGSEAVHLEALVLSSIQATSTSSPAIPIHESEAIGDQNEISITLGCFFFSSASLGTVIFKTPFSSLALIASKSAFSGNRKRLQNFPLILSERCHLSPSRSSSAFISPLTLSTLFSSTSIFTSSFFIPGTSTAITCSDAVSFQSARAKAKGSEALVGTGKGVCSRILKGSSEGMLFSITSQSDPPVSFVLLVYKMKENLVESGIGEEESRR
ncbi:hypothetical protein F8388_017618 [Cannabis sativa]|uniref:Uncharacterized protein n=1 Tax=Cannabis sativa TaxID=3483 RepID=A0A7J6I7U7_CANSA|nr:hypothetical protein F8388_017618 [Cannabis sativa]KAF4403633.1 hypothetical protein G4B88_002486 [Cannabis sativa]